MFAHKKVKTGKKWVEAILIKLLKKNLILLRGKKGYVMCGYLDLGVAEKFAEAGVRIVDVSTIDEALNAKVHSCTTAAKELGIYEGQPVKDVLELIA